MEITDLQINDWVYDKSLTVPNLPCRIYSIEGRFPRKDKDFNDQPLIVVWVGDGFLSSHIENIEPIPLTEEILQLNGLDPISYCDLSMPRWFMSLRSGNHHVEMPFQYVHQLQHALRLCGLNDLAENFKV